MPHTNKACGGLIRPVGKFWAVGNLKHSLPLDFSGYGCFGSFVITQDYSRCGMKRLVLVGPQVTII
jgi:hypothetical protein